MQRTQAVHLYRLLLRTQRRTFKGDDVVLRAAHARTRAEFEEKRGETDPEKIQKSLDFGKEVATLLERNIAQASRVDGGEAGVYRLHLNERHEIKTNPPVIKSDLKKNRQKKTKKE